MANWRVLILSRDSVAASIISSKLISDDDVDFETRRFQHINYFSEAVAKYRPHIIIADRMFFRTNPSEIERAQLFDEYVILLTDADPSPINRRNNFPGRRIGWEVSRGAIVRQKELAKEVAYRAGVPIKGVTRASLSVALAM